MTLMILGFILMIVGFVVAYFVSNHMPNLSALLPKQSNISSALSKRAGVKAAEEALKEKKTKMHAAKGAAKEDLDWILSDDSEKERV